MNEWMDGWMDGWMDIQNSSMELYVLLKRNTIVLNFKRNGFINYLLNIPPIYAYILSPSKYCSFFKVNLTNNQI
jgi:hypothetical protein